MKLTNAIFLGIILAVVLGLIANVTGTEVTDPVTGAVSLQLHPAFGWLMPVSVFVGDVFIKCIKMLVAPLILTAIVSGVSSIPAGGGAARLGFKTVAYYLTTTMIAVMVAIAIVSVIQPGVGKNIDEIRAQLSGAIAEGDARFESIEQSDRPTTSGELVTSIVDQCLTNPFKALTEMNVLGIITFSLLLGLILPRIGDRGKPLIKFFDSAFEAIMALVTVILWTAPFGAFGLLFKVLAPVGMSLFIPLGAYMLSVIAGLSFHAFVTLPLLLIIFAKVSPWKFFLAFREAFALGLSTSSSSATLPVTMRCVEENMGVSNRVSSFVLPLGSTVNMDGTALYEAVAAIFIAQVFGIDFTFQQLIIVALTATIAGIGAAGIPSAGLVTMFIVFQAAGIPAAGIALIIPVDRVLDMLRTTVNIGGDSVGAVIIAKSEGEELKF